MKKKAFRSWILVFSFVVFAFALAGCNDSFQTSGAKRVDVVDLLPQAKRIIEQGLSGRDARVRAKAIEVVADTGQMEFMPRVADMLGNEYVPVRFAAALAVGDTVYKPAEDKIKRLLNAPDENTRIAAAYAMVKLGSAKHFNMLLKAIGSKDQTIRANAAILLGKSGYEKALKPLNWALKDEDSGDKVRFVVAESIARLGDEQILPKLWAIALSAYADDRSMGVRAIGLLGTEKAKDVLVTMLDDKVLEVRLAVAGELGMLGDMTGESEVLRVFEENLRANLSGRDLERVNVLTALAIGQIRSDALAGYLPQFLENESESVRLAAAKAILQYVRQR